MKNFVHSSNTLNITALYNVGSMLSPRSPSPIHLSEQFNMPFPLFKLPLEVREAIYDATPPVMNGGRQITPSIERNRRFQNQREDDSHFKDCATVNGNITILQACQQIYHEGMRILYSIKTLYFSDHEIHPHRTLRIITNRPDIPFLLHRS